jgi:TBC1 domain family member 10
VKPYPVTILFTDMEPLGIPILIRAGMAIVYCCRRAILDSKSEENALALLRKPNPNWLPPSADAFILLLNSVKLKDEDVKKQRVKMEHQLTKRQAQQQVSLSTPIRSAASISLPRQ